MNRTKFKLLQAVLTSRYWLILTLSGVYFVFFALNRGGVNFFIVLSVSFLILNVLTGEYPLKKIPGYYLIIVAICVYLLLVSVIVSPEQSHSRWMKNLVRMLGLIFCIHCLSQKKIDDRVVGFFAIVLSLGICWQFAVHVLFDMPYGTLTNRHYLASFTVCALPMIIYFFCVAKGWYKCIVLPIALIGADLLLQSGSRPAFLGIICGALFVIIFLTKGRGKWVGIASMLLVLGVLFITDYANMASRIEDLIVNIAEEERVQFCTEAWNKLEDNSLMSWIFGHGIQWFPVSYTENSVTIRFVSPHNHFLEIVYLNGLVGLILVYGGLAVLFLSVVNKAKQTHDKRVRILLKCILVTFLSWFIHCGLTFPFYSKYSIYSLAFILGLLLVLITKKSGHQQVKRLSS